MYNIWGRGEECEGHGAAAALPRAGAEHAAQEAGPHLVSDY